MAKQDAAARTAALSHSLELERAWLRGAPAGIRPNHSTVAPLGYAARECPTVDSILRGRQERLDWDRAMWEHSDSRARELDAWYGVLPHEFRARYGRWPASYSYSPPGAARLPLLSEHAAEVPSTAEVLSARPRGSPVPAVRPCRFG